jgi:hypothetical protein
MIDVVIIGKFTGRRDASLSGIMPCSSRKWFVLMPLWVAAAILAKTSHLQPAHRAADMPLTLLAKMLSLCHSPASLTRAARRSVDAASAFPAPIHL